MANRRRLRDPATPTWLCKGCGVEKPVTEFYPSARVYCGLSSRCKACHASEYRKRRAARLAEYRERDAAAQRRRAAVNPERVRAEGRAADEKKRLANPEAYRRKIRKAWSDWRLAHPEKARELKRAHVARRRAIQMGVTVETVVASVVFERDGWTCQLCGKPIDKRLTGTTPTAPSIDHKVPLARGGAHEYANVQAAHFGCNARKGARDVRDPSPGVACSPVG